MTAHWQRHFLTGMNVLEMGTRPAAGACGQLLAMLGATVSVLHPANGAAIHGRPRHAVFSFGKNVLPMYCAAGPNRAELEARLAQADVVILSTDVDRDPLRWETQGDPRQIVCDITAFGHTGPLAGAAYSEALLQAMAGSASTTGRADGPPTLSAAPLLEMQSAVYSACAILAAVHARNRCGSGQRIDMAIFDVAVNALLTFIPLELSGRGSGRTGNRHPTLVPWNSYRALDGWILICAPTDEQWRRLCQAMASPQLGADPRFSNPAARLQHIDEINAIIAEWTNVREAAVCLDTLAKHGVPSGTMTDISALETEPNLRHRRMFLHPAPGLDGKHLVVPGCPVQIVQDGQPEVARSREAPGSAAPGIGASPVVRPLAGLRVVEIGTNTVGPLAGRQLGALGAEVTKIEPPSGDSSRSNAPFRNDGQSYAFVMSNTDKSGVVLDLRADSDRQRLCQMLEKSDVLIENLKPGSLDKLGLGAAELVQRFPNLIYCSISGFGHHTVYPMRPAFDSIIQAMSGIMSTVSVDGMPTKTGVSTSDLLGGQFGLLAVLAASLLRDRTGTGMRLDLAMLDCSAWATQTLWNESGSSGPSVAILKTQNGWVAVEAAREQLELLRVQLSDRELTQTEILAHINTMAGCIAVPVQTVGEVLRHPQTIARSLLKTVAAPDGAHWQVLQSPLRLQSTPPDVRSAMPPLAKRSSGHEPD